MELSKLATGLAPASESVAAVPSAPVLQIEQSDLVAANTRPRRSCGWNRKCETYCTCECPQTPASRVSEPLSQRPRRRAERVSELRRNIMIVFIPPHLLKWAVNAHCHRRFSKGAEGLTGKVR